LSIDLRDGSMTLGIRSGASFQLSESLWACEEGECLDVIWPHDIEVPVVQRGDFSEPQALRDGDLPLGIDDAEREINVGLDKPGHAQDVLVLKFSEVEAVAAERLQKVTSAYGPTRD
jgi:hypothetical protein